MKFLIVAATLTLALFSAAIEEERILTNGRIIGGEDSPPGAYPWFTALITRTNSGNFLSCGGQLISPTFVLTAAHCVTTLSSDDVITYVGSFQRPLRLNGGQPIEVFESDEIILHPNWNSELGVEGGYDFALIRLRIRDGRTASATPARLDLSGISKSFEGEDIKISTKALCMYGCSGLCSFLKLTLLHFIS